ncbi:MAG: tRNA (N6-isopentenyl adenosine(37)-C2)-methylthiotransferase MiaB [Clostridia bacterium]|nr:tRNA (N6-isopentenyl adenosine(37)-C2)-methylthiotransferase MiaB [Clostridia bacterium]
MKKIYVATFGCQQNEADSETILGIAGTLGFVPVSTPEEADLILYNTCAVREHAELKALSTTGQLKHLKEKNRDLKIGLCGCMIQQEHRKEDVKNKYPYVDFVFGTNMISRLPEILEKVYGEKKRHFFVEDYKDNPGAITEGLPVCRRYAYKAYVSIMYGCNNFCTYCVVPYVRGRERSREEDAVVAEVERLVKGGAREITLLGQNVNSYGKDLATPVSFAHLLRRISALPGDFILRFMTSHPKDATSELIDAMAESGKCERHFHLPLQAGSDEILRRMNRHYDKARYLSLVEEIREKIPGVSLTTDVIVGFPGETEEDFAQTLAVLEKVRFDGVFSFIYSPRKGTPAASYPDPVPPEVSRERMGRLLALQTRIQTENNERYLGREVLALCEGPSKTDPAYYSARTSEARLIHFPGDERVCAGEFVRLRITEARAIMLIGEMIS